MIVYLDKESFHNKLLHERMGFFIFLAGSPGLELVAIGPNNCQIVPPFDLPKAVEVPQFCWYKKGGGNDSVWILES